MSGSAKGPPTASYTADPAPNGRPGAAFTLGPVSMFSRGPWGRKRILRKKDSRGQIFWREEEVVRDVVMLSSTLFHEGRVDSGLDSSDSRRIGLGLCPVGSCRVPLKVQGH